VRRPSRLIAALLAILSLTAAPLVSAFTYRAEQRRLSGDWRGFETAASCAGLRLAGTPSGKGGWPLAASLHIVDPALLLSGDPILRADDLDLTRSLLHPASLRLHPLGLAARDGQGRAVRIWAETLAFARDPDGSRTLSMRDGRLALGPGPDDVATIATASLRTDPHPDPDLDPDPHATRTSVTVDHATLPLSWASGADRAIRHADLELRLSGPARSRSIQLQRADLLWGDLAARLDGSLVAESDGVLSGRLSLSLHSGWRTAIERAAAARVISPSVARASIGLLSLLAPNGDASDLPVAIDHGRVMLGGLFLATLPALPALPDLHSAACHHGDDDSGP
jgi:hypothetical protein